MLLLAVVAGIGAGAFWQPRPAQAETIRELSWYLDAMHVESAHRISKGNGVVVAVVDSGVDSSHPDLQGRVLKGGVVGEDPDEKVSGDGRDDEDGHGTGMASLIAGTGKGANSILGVAPEAKILPVRLEQNSEGSFRPEYVYRGVRWAIDHGAKIVNMSLGGGRSTDAPWKKELIDYAIEKDVVLIAAAGNVDQGDTQVAEPASIPGVVAVSGVTEDGTFWDGSAKGPEVVLSAPAEQLPAAAPHGLKDSTGYVLADGTSGATALVSGVAALIRSAFPDASASEVVNRLIRTAEDRGKSGRDDQYGFGVVDARAALEGDVPKVNHHPLVSPEAAKSDEAAAARRERSRARNGALYVVSAFIGGAILLLVGGYLVVLARRSRRVVVAGMAPGGAPVAMSAGALWGQRGSPDWPTAPPGAPQYAVPGQPGPPGPFGQPAQFGQPTPFGHPGQFTPGQSAPPGQAAPPGWSGPSGQPGQAGPPSPPGQVAPPGPPGYPGGQPLVPATGAAPWGGASPPYPPGTPQPPAYPPNAPGGYPPQPGGVPQPAAGSGQFPSWPPNAAPPGPATPGTEG
ncbi:MAG: type VII secretion-associated serine protease mycosin, partial [Micromonosporaceae bacterium]